MPRSTKMQNLESDEGQPAEDAIRRRAFELYQERGGAPGSELDDWDRAKRELQGRSILPAPANRAGPVARLMNRQP